MQFPAEDGQIGATVLTGAGALNGPAQRLGHGLESVADSEDRYSEVEHRRIEPGCAVGVHAGRPAGQDDRLRVLGLDLLDAGGVRDDLGEHPGLADAPGDQLRVLGTEIDHQDRTRRIHRHSLRFTLGQPAATPARWAGCANRRAR